MRLTQAVRSVLKPQAVDAQHALLIDGFDRHEMHLRSAGSFADGGGIVGIVFSALPCRPQAGLRPTFFALSNCAQAQLEPQRSALQPVRGHQMGRDDSGIQAQAHQLAGPVVGAGTGFHGHQTTGG